MATLTLKPGRDKPLVRRHPWIFSGAVDRVEGGPRTGDTVEVRAAGGRFVARAAYSPKSQIRARAWTFAEEDAVDEGLLRRRLESALAARSDLLRAEDRTALRLVNAESDGLPGLIVDRYGDWLVVQLLAAGAEAWREMLVGLLGELAPAAGIWERSDGGVRRKEGLEPRTGRLAGEHPPPRIEIVEGACRFLVDVRTGHKTGFYLDQAANRLAVAPLAAGRRVLDAFSYTGGFSVAAGHGGAAALVELEGSSEALEMARANWALNGLDESLVERIEGNAFQTLRRLRSEDRRFDLVVLDPPKFADSARRVERASRGYKDINLLAFQLLAPGGLLATFSCSGAVSEELFQKIVAGAALDSGRFVRVLDRLGASPDHPTALSFPQGSYLKGLLCRVD